jgi:hypothetical protein
MLKTVLQNLTSAKKIGGVVNLGNEQNWVKIRKKIGTTGQA